MNARIWGIIGGVALVLALLSPLVLGSAQKVERLFKTAEILYERLDYEGAIIKYKEALKESKKLGAKTERIDKDFTTLANLKIARCYYELAEDSSDVRHYQSALTHVRKVVSNTKDSKHQEELTYLWAEILYKTGDFDQAKSKFSWLIEKFPNSQWMPKALYVIGNINAKQENYDEALRAFQKLVNEFPNSDWAPGALYTIGYVHYEQQHYNEALHAFQKLVDEFPHSELKAETERRIAEIEDLVNHDTPPDPECETEARAMYVAASELQLQGKDHEAYQLYTNLITQYLESKYVSDAYVGRAEIYLEAADYVNARANYEEAMRNTDDKERKIELYEAYHRTYLVPVYADRPRPYDPSDELFVEARLLRKEERFLEAAEMYEQLVNSNLSTEDTVYALYWAGRCYHAATLQISTLTDAALFSKSVDAFKKLITNHEGNSYDIKVYHYLALAYTDWAKISGDPSKCQSVIDTIKEANTKYEDSDDATVKGWLSRMQELKNGALEKLLPPPDQAKKEAEHTIKTAETAIAHARQENSESQLIRQANKHLKHAKQYMHRGEYKDALSEAKEANKIMKKTPISLSKKDHVDQGRIHLRQGKLAEATKKARQAQYLDPNYVPAYELLSEIKEKHYGRGWTFFDEGQYKKAIAEFRNAINIDSHFKEAYCHLGVIYIEQQKYSKAIKALKNAIKIDNKFKEAHFNLALAHLELGEFEASTNAANVALEIDPNYEPARMLIEFIAD